MPALLAALDPIPRGKCKDILDIGCGYGGLTSTVGRHLGAATVYGVDIDPRGKEEAEEKGVTFECLDVERTPLPYADASFDFVMSLGMLDYLPTFDGLLSEVRRVLRVDGHALLSIPNLGSWHNRIALLLGFQPRDIEVSNEAVVGTFARYRNDLPAGHLHTATLKAFTELMQIHGFDELEVRGGAWKTTQIGWPVAVLDRLFSYSPSLARRFFYLGTRSTREISHGQNGWWRGREELRGT
jgi:SAM-dependent methyltransferase